jgi:hypothetical protein
MKTTLVGEASRCGLRRGVLAGLACLGLLPVETTQASPIHGFAIGGREPRRLSTIGAFVPRRLELRSRVAAPHFSAGVRITMADSSLMETPFVRYLLWRRGLDPARFDHYHPRIGPILASLSPPPPSPPTSVPTTHPTPPPSIPQPQGLNVPEPPTTLLALALIGAALWWRRATAAYCARA